MNLYKQFYAPPCGDKEALQRTWGMVLYAIYIGLVLTVRTRRGRGPVPLCIVVRRRNHT